MRYLSVCSGIEAASVAWHPLGWRAVAFSEIGAFPSAVLRVRWPEVPNWGDIQNYEQWPDATIDVLAAGTPCQDFSVAGLRAGLHGERGSITLTFLRLLERYLPRWVVWENVPGVFSAPGNPFGALLTGLSERGYGWAYRVFNAQYFGVPQRRRRVFVVGHFGDWRRAAAVLFERHSLQGHHPPRRSERQKTTPGPDGGPSGFAFKASHYTRNKDGAPSEIAPPLSADADKGDQDTLVLMSRRVRRFTPLECERLQGFPDHYTLVDFNGKPAKDSPRYKAVGNSMAVPVMSWIGQRIEMVDKMCPWPAPVKLT